MVFGTISGSVEAKFGLVGKPRVSSIDFNRLNGAEISTWNMQGAAPLDPLFYEKNAHGSEWVKTLQTWVKTECAKWWVTSYVRELLTLVRV